MGDWTPPDRRFSELPLRLASAFFLIPPGLAAVWMGGVWLALACAVFAGIMMQEWCAMSRMTRPRLMTALAGLFGLSLAAGGVLAPAMVFVLVFTGALLLAGPGARARLTAGSGVVYIFSMVSGLFLLREGSWDGRAAALYFMSFVWASDAAAYFAGRLLRGPRLLPRESPNKTWSGAIAAVLACAICGYSASGIEGVASGAWIAAGIVISIVAQAGDLFESGVKRRFGVKDSGKILPGHGGLLDRVDGLGAVGIAGSAGLLLFPGLSGLLGL